MNALRQARLRPEFSKLYPGVPAGVWEVAANLAERMQRRREWRAELTPRQGRLMNDAHFEFRGGGRLAAVRSAERTRLEDQLGA